MKIRKSHAFAGCCSVIGFLLGGCAQPMAAPQSGKVNATIGEPAEQQAGQLAVAAGGSAKGKRAANLETVALFNGPAMPTGVTVSKSGRIFLSFPRWSDKVDNTVVELKDGQLVAFPDEETNKFDPSSPRKFDPITHLVSVQSVVVDSRDRLWLLDTGSINFGPNLNGAAKLWGYDLATGKLVKKISFPTDVVMKTTALNDVRFDLNRGTEGTAYITDSGVGGFIIVDLASGASWRHLDDHPFVKPTPGLQQTTEGQPFLQRKPTGEVDTPDLRSDGIAISADGSTLFYTIVAGRDVYAVPTNLLADRNADEGKIALAVKKVATKPSGTDGILCDDQDRIYTADFEDNAIRRVNLKGSSATAQIIVQDERMLWPDTLAMHNGYLYVTSNQLARQSIYHGGKDERQPPYALFRVRVEDPTKTAGSN